MAEPASAPILDSEHSERRDHARKSAINATLVTVDIEPGGFGLMLDVNENGAGVQIMNRIEPGTKVNVGFRLPGSESRIEGSGVIAWCDGEGRAGIRFQQLNTSTELKKWIDSLPEAVIVDTTSPTLLDVRNDVSQQVQEIRAQVASQEDDAGFVLQFLIERVVELTHANGGAIALGESNNMVCCASTGMAPDLGVRIGSGSALTAECLRTGKIVRCEDTETDVRVDDEICRELNLRSAVILPILFQGQVRGVLEVFSPQPYAFKYQDIGLLQQLAEFTAQVAYGQMPTSAVKISHSAKSQAKPNHAELSALLETPPLEEKSPQTPAQTQPLQPPSGTIEDAASSPAERLSPPFASYPANEKASASSPTSLLIVLAAALILVAALVWYRSRGNAPVPPSPANAVTPHSQTTQEPAPLPVNSAPVQPATEKEGSGHTAASEPVRARLPERSSEPAPIVIFSRSGPVRTDNSAVAPPAIANVATTPSLGGIKLPGSNAQPVLRPQGVVTGGVLLQRVEPEYPSFAKVQRIEGDVVLSATVGKDGSVTRLRKISGNPLLAQAAISAVRKWRYEPYKLNGELQEVEISIAVQFRLK